jgi:predicted DsbA family dithiol-disulfide isomerase
LLLGVYCELGRVRLKKALEMLEVEKPNIVYKIRWRPFLLYDIPEDGIQWSAHMRNKWGTGFD